MDALVHPRKKKGAGGRAGEQLPESQSWRRRFWVMLYAEDAGVVSQSPEQLLRKMMGVTVVVYAAFGLTVSEAKTEIMCLRAKRGCWSPPPRHSAYRQRARCITKRTSSHASGGTSTTMLTCPSRLYGAYATHGAASGSIPSNCTADRVLPSSSKSGCSEPRYSRQCYTAASRGAGARASTTRCAVPTTSS